MASIVNQSSPKKLDSTEHDSSDASLLATTTNDNFDCPKEECDSDSNDIDLSAIEVASSLIEQTLSMENPEIVVPDDNQACKNIMIVCSNTAQDIKKSLNTVLVGKETSTNDEATTKLQESLNERIADFEKVVSGCMQVGSSVEISEVLDEVEKSIGNEEVKHVDVSISEVAESTTHPSCELFAKPETECCQKECSHLSKTPEEPGLVKQARIQAEALNDFLKTVEEGKSTKKQKNTPSKKKIEKNIELITKSLSGCPTSEEKLLSVIRKYAEAQEEYRLVEPRMRQLERQVVGQQREKEVLQAEHNRTVLAKSRLESLCRELQRQNKAVKEESVQRIREEEEKRKEIAGKFQATLNDISGLMQENASKNSQLRDENQHLAGKLKGLVDNYEVWEQNMQKVIQQRELEAQLARAKQAKTNLLLKQETEKFLREKQALLQAQTELQARCTQLTQNELQLRTELAEYSGKYDEFQNVLASSGKIFAGFKTDMEATSKKIKKLEKETNVYKQKWTSSNNALLEMVTYKEKQDKEIASGQQRIAMLEKLCRALQGERNDLQGKLDALSSSAEEIPVPPITVETEAV